MQISQESTIRNRKWFNSPISEYEGSLLEIGRYIPDFERHPFEYSRSEKDQKYINNQFDVIVRKPIGEDSNYIPIGIVSKEYSLVKHAEVLNTAIIAFKDLGISLQEIKAELSLTEFGERMELSIYFPDEYLFDPGDGHPLTLRLECFNSVDGSSRFRILLGWFRFVCSNGLVIGITKSDYYWRHIGDFRVSDIGMVLKAGLNQFEDEKRNLLKWRKCMIHINRIHRWINEDVRKAWGFKAAARVYHISRTGHDIEIIGPFAKNIPTSILVRKANKLPGTPKEIGNLYDLSQVLSWLAKERRDLQEQLQWREQIPELLNKVYPI